MKFAKKIIILVALILCVGTFQTFANNFEYQPKYTIKELMDKFNYKKANFLVDGYKVEYASFNRGDKVEIDAHQDGYYYVYVDEVLLAIEEKFVRLENESVFEEYSAYAQSGAKAYSDYELSQQIAKFSLNERVKVIDKVGEVNLVEYNGIIAYMDANKLSKKKIVVETTPTPSNGGGSSSGGQSNSPTSGDGEDISIAYNQEDYVTRSLVNTDSNIGYVLIDNTKAYSAILTRGEEIKVTKQEGEISKVLFEGFTAEIPSKYLRLQGEDDPEIFERYVKAASKVYEEYSFENVKKTLTINTVVTIVEEIDDYYIISLEDGFGYIKKENTSTEKYKVYVPEKKQEEGSSGGGGSSTPASDSEPEWTEPVL